jgi:polyisoprenoid-binding protein YceI
LSCANTPDGAQSTTSEKQEASTLKGDVYPINTSKSSLKWEGTGVGHGHNGTFTITEGNLAASEGKLTGGSFAIDVKGITTTDLKGKDSSDLLGHLLSKDFFEADKYPSAKFVITNVTESKEAGANYTISGNLTLKDSTKNVSFPANVTFADKVVNAEAKFVIDRTQWGMFYNSEQSVGDHFISPKVGISVSLTTAQ